MMFSSNDNVPKVNDSKENKNNKRKAPHPLLRPFIEFWRFSRYYAEYKARIRGY